MASQLTATREQQLAETASAIALEFGPRLPGSRAERAAAQYLYTRLSGAGLATELQPVLVPRYQHLPLIAGYALMVAAAIVLASSPPLAALLAAGGLLTLVTEAHASPTVSRLLPKAESLNVVARRASQGQSERRLVFTAHLDTARPTLFTSPRVVVIERQSFMFALNASIIVFVLGLLGSFSPLGGLVWVGFGGGLYLILHLTVLVHGALNLPPSPGANDNASGLAVLVDLAEQLPPLEHTELWLVATCGHEAGLAGMRAFLQQNPMAGLATQVVNLDSVGAGTINLTLVEGYLRSRRVSRELLETGAWVVHEAGLPVRARAYQGTPTEAYAALRAGLPAISIIGFDRRGAVPNWHWHSDTVDNLEPATMAVAAKLVEGMVSRLDVSLKTTLPPGS